MGFAFGARLRRLTRKPAELSERVAERRTPSGEL
jgi:hypothetical protein